MHIQSLNILCYLRFCWFVDLPLVRCVAVPDVFVGEEACCLPVGHRGHS
jgi:hypothetical protein